MSAIIFALSYLCMLGVLIHKTLALDDALESLERANSEIDRLRSKKTVSTPVGAKKSEDNTWT